MTVTPDSSGTRSTTRAVIPVLVTKRNASTGRLAASFELLDR
jgi:hypothetical protein